MSKGHKQCSGNVRAMWAALAVATGVSLLWAGAAVGTLTPEQKCNQKRYIAAAQYYWSSTTFPYLPDNA
jgi:hypothetical protein